MAEFYLAIFAALLVGGLVRGLCRPARMYQYPYFMAAVFAAFLLPQAISLISNRGRASGGVESVLLMANLCLAMVYISALFAPIKSVVKIVSVEMDERRLLQAGIVLTGIGTVASYFLQKAAAEYTGDLWTGKITIYFFFASFELPGAVIALTIGWRRGGALAWTVAGIALIPPVAAIYFSGNRETAAYVIVAIGLTIYFWNRWVPPRLLILLMLVFAALIIPAIGDYRKSSGSADGPSIAKLDLLGKFKAFMSSSSVLELRNAAMLIDETEQRGSYEFGTGYWDQIIWRYVPAQFFGRDTKQALMFHYDEKDREEALLERGYQIPAGSTSTGLGDSFVQFGFAGSIFFCLLGILMKSLWTASLGRSGTLAQLLYITSVTSAMRAVTNQTTDFLPGMLFNLIFIGAAARYAWKRKRPRPHPFGPKTFANSRGRQFSR